MDKIRPGVYVNVGTQLRLTTRDSLGKVIMPLSLNWGANNFIEVFADQTGLYQLGYTMSDEKMLPIQLALKKANSVLVYRLNTGTKAAGEAASGITLTAKYGGTRGNDLSVKIKTLNDGTFKVTTYLDALELDEQIIHQISEFKDNGFIILSGEGTLTDKTILLTGGTDIEPSVTAMDEFLEAAKLQEFNIITSDTDDLTIKNKIVNFVKEQRSHSHLMQAVLENINADYEGVISVKNGFVLEDGKILSAKQACAYVAGASAAAGYSTSLTFAKVDNAVDCNPKLTDDQIKQAILEGHLVFSQHKSGVVIEYDINSLTTFTQKSKDIRKNKVVRVMDGIHFDVITLYESRFIGKVQNNVDGRNLLKGALADYLNSLQDLGVIEDFIAAEDIQIQPMEDKDSVHIQLAVKPTDTVDKIVIDVEVE